MKWVLTIKKMEKPVRFKARLCALGFMQDESTIGETFAPTGRAESSKLIIIAALKYNLQVSVMDIEGAFLKATLPEPIIARAPPGVKLQKGEAIKIVKSIYGLKEAPRLFNLLLNKTLEESELTNSIYEPCVWYNSPEKESEKVLIVTHVDDLLIAAPKGFVEKLKVNLCESKANLVGKVSALSVYLGRQYHHEKGNKTVNISMKKYIESLQRKFNPTGKKAETPAAHTVNIEPSETEIDVTIETPYRQIIGSLLYAAQERPDIKFQVQRLAKFCHTPTKKLYDAAERVVQYLNQTSDKGLRISADEIENMEISAESDSDWGRDTKTSRNMQVMVISLGGIPIVRKTRQDKAPTQSTNEAEIRALGFCAKEVIYYRKLMKEIGFPQENATVIFTDSLGAIATIEGESTSDAQKHIRMKKHALQDLTKRGKIKLEYKNTAIIRADLLTKNLNKEGHERQCSLYPGLGKE